MDAFEHVHLVLIDSVTAPMNSMMDEMKDSVLERSSRAVIYAYVISVARIHVPT
jgi:hypothetical protein